jgi:DNA gyrase subunit A
MGVKSMKMGEGEVVVSMTLIKPGADMLTISENGYGKRTSESEYRVQGRNGKGIKAGIFNEITGKLVNLKQVTDEDDIMMIADDGVIIRVTADEISRIGRNTKGVKIMKIKDKSRIVCVAVTKSEKSEEELAETLVEEEVVEPVAENIPVETMEEETVETTTQEDNDLL